MTHAANVDPDFIIALKARDRIADPQNWCTMWYYGPNSNSKQSCWAGQFMRVVGLNPPMVSSPILMKYPTLTRAHVAEVMAKKLGFEGMLALEDFNDKHTYEEVVAEFDKRLATWPNGVYDETVTVGINIVNSESSVSN